MLVLHVSGVSHHLWARVLHVTPLPDGGSLVGCQFLEPLEEAEFQTLR